MTQDGSSPYRNQIDQLKREILQLETRCHHLMTEVYAKRAAIEAYEDGERSLAYLLEHGESVMIS